ncbi:MAG: helix-turn-helix domain-containing protein [Sphingorhabdus sp.]
MASLNDRERHLMIKLMLRTKRISFTELAHANNVTVSTVSLVSRGRAKSARLETALAAELGLTREELWPDRPMEAIMP